MSKPFSVVTLVRDFRDRERERERKREREPGPRSQDHVRLLGARLSRGHVLRTSIYRGDENAYERKKGERKRDTKEVVFPKTQ